MDNPSVVMLYWAVEMARRVKLSPIGRSLRKETPPQARRGCAAVRMAAHARFEGPAKEAFECRQRDFFLI